MELFNPSSPTTTKVPKGKDCSSPTPPPILGRSFSRGLLGLRLPFRIGKQKTHTLLVEVDPEGSLVGRGRVQEPGGWGWDWDWMLLLQSL